MKSRRRRFPSRRADFSSGVVERRHEGGFHSEGQVLLDSAAAAVARLGDTHGLAECGLLDARDAGSNSEMNLKQLSLLNPSAEGGVSFYHQLIRGRAAGHERPRHGP